MARVLEGYRVLDFTHVLAGPIAFGPNRRDGHRSSVFVKFDGKTAVHGQGNPRRLADLRNGDRLQIRGRRSGGNTVLAREVERSGPTSNVQVQDLVTSAADPIIVLLGASIDRSLIPENGLRGRYGVIGRSAFFSGLSTGMTVVLRGTVLDDMVAWSSTSRRE